MPAHGTMGDPLESPVVGMHGEVLARLDGFVRVCLLPRGGYPMVLLQLLPREGGLVVRWVRG